MKPLYNQYSYPKRFTISELRRFLAKDSDYDFIPYRIEDGSEEVKELSADFSRIRKWINDQIVIRDIKYIVVHCTATRQDAKVSSIVNYWKNSLGWKNPGYHIIIKHSGEYSILKDLDHSTNGVYGYNKNSIHISYIGGVDEDLKPLDNRTKEQKEILHFIVEELQKKFKAIVKGHRDFPNVKKACPSFDAIEEYKNL